MRPRTLRARLALSAAVAILVALALLTIVVSALLGSRLHDSLDTTLRQRAGEVARLSATAPALLTRPAALDSPLAGRQLLVEVIDRRGRIVARSSGLNGDVLNPTNLIGAALTNVKSAYEDSTRNGDPLRLYVAPLAATGGPASGGAVVVAASTADVQVTLDTLHRLALLALIGATVLGAALATMLARRALRPLERLSTAAAEIEKTGDATRRLPEPAGDDEVARLAATLNAMLATLERAREAERRFVGDASHELRTPLTALRGNAAYVARHGADPAVLADIEHDAERLSALIDDLLALAREDAAETPASTVRLDELAHEAAAAQPPDTTIQISAPEPVTVLGDPEALRRALDNLLDNARRHGPHGGTVKVAVTQHEATAELTVTDDGPGLPPHEARHAFERFWRGPSARTVTGTGLGLAIVRATAERHGGTATMERSRVTLRLPARPAAPLSQKPHSRGVESTQPPAGDTHQP